MSTRTNNRKKGGGRASLLDDDSRLQSFYNEAANNKRPYSPTMGSQQQQPLSQESGSLSLAELSRMEENLLSQSSHHEEEESRQHKKLEKRAATKNKVNQSSGRKRKPRTEVQKERIKKYNRYAFKKRTDMSSEEDDSAKSMEVLVRGAIFGQIDELKRLEKVAANMIQRKEEEEEEKHHSDLNNDDAPSLEVTNGDISKAEANNDIPKNAKETSHDGVNWNFLDEGYVTMPQSDAKKLPYYAYYDRKPSSHEKKRQNVDEMENKSRSDDAQQHCTLDIEGINEEWGKASAPRHLKKKQKKVGKKRQRAKKKRQGVDEMEMQDIREDGDVPRSFPLHFYQFDPGMDLHGMIDTRHGNTSVGVDRMQYYHGRNVKKLYARMVAGGALNHDFNDSSDDIDNKNDPMSIEQDVMSEMSPCSESSKSSEEEEEEDPYEMMATQETNTSALDVKDNTDLVVNNVEQETNERNPLLRLMSTSHSLPRITHKSRFILKVAQELGANRRLWENELKSLLEGYPINADNGGNAEGNSSIKVTSEEIRLVKSFLGVEGKLSCPPLWLCDPTMPTHPTFLKNRMKGVRSSLLKRLRRIPKLPSDDVIDSVPKSKEGTGEVINKGLQSEGLQGEDVNMDKTESSTVDEFPHTKFDNDDEEEEVDDPDATTKHEINKPYHSLLDRVLQSTTDTEDEKADKYAKIIHDADIDPSNVDVTLAWFVAQLTYSKARLSQYQQQLDSSSLKAAQDEVRLWHESIISYLNMAEELAKPSEANFFKSDGVYPQSAPLAHAVMKTQSYLATTGQMAAKDLAIRGNQRLSDKHLTRFVPIHLTTGIAMIADTLPPPASDLVSRSCCPDSSDNRSPFDLIRNVVALLENDGSLIFTSETSLGVSNNARRELMVAMDKAATIFQKCAEEEPTDVDHWSWYVAALLGALCIAYDLSANASRSYSNDDDEYQQQIAALHKLRHDASVGLTDFLKFTKLHGCPMFHFTVTTMLEWNKAIALLHRPQPTGFGLEVKKLHAYHTYQWACKIISTTSLAKVQHLYKSNYLPRDALLNVMACAIDQDPSKRENWARFVRVLGRIDQNDNENGVCLHMPAKFNEEHWWGKNLVVAEKEFFRVPQSALQKVKPKFVKIVAAVVDSALATFAQVQQVPQIESNASKDMPIPDPSECMNWIWREDENDMNDDYTDMRDNIHMLPTDTPPIASPFLEEPEIQERLSHNPSCEARCMKILVASHLLGVWHPFVCNSVWWLAVKLWHSNQQSTTDQFAPTRFANNSYANGLAWLEMHGLDISVYIQCRLKHS